VFSSNTPFEQETALDVIDVSATLAGQTRHDWARYEAERTGIHQAWEKRQNQPGSDLVARFRNQDGGRLGHHSNATETESPPIDEHTNWAHLLPDEFWKQRPHLEHIRSAALHRLISPDAVLASVLARVVASTHHRWALPPILGRVAGLELIVGIVGSPGLGKGAAMDLAKTLLQTNKTFNHLQAAPLIDAPAGSGEGMVKAFFGMVTAPNPETNKPERTQQRTAWNALFRIDEIDTLAKLAKRQDQTTMDFLRRAWSREQLGARYSDQDKDRQLDPGTYRIAVVIGAQPEHTRFIFDETSGGTPQRFIWASAHHHLNGHETANEVGPLNWKPPQPPKPTTDNEPAYLEVAEPIRVHLRQQHYATVTSQEADPHRAHSGLRRLKVAAALAVLDGRPNIRTDDWELAGYITDASDRVAAQLQATNRRLDLQAAAAAAHKAGEVRKAQLRVEDEARDKAIQLACARIVTYLSKGPQKRAEINRNLGSKYKSEVKRSALDELAAEGYVSELDGLWSYTGKQVPNEWR